MKILKKQFDKTTKSVNLSKEVQMQKGMKSYYVLAKKDDVIELLHVVAVSWPPIGSEVSKDHKPDDVWTVVRVFDESEEERIKSLARDIGWDKVKELFKATAFEEIHF